MLKKKRETSIFVVLCLLACFTMGYTAYVCAVFDPAAPRPIVLSDLLEQWPPLIMLPISAVLLLMGIVARKRWPGIAPAISTIGAMIGSAYYVMTLIVLPIYLVLMWFDIRVIAFVTVPSVMLVVIILYPALLWVSRQLRPT